MLLDDAIRHHARFRSKQPALVFDDARLNYAELDDRIDRCAAMFSARGIGKGDRVAVVTANHPDFATLLFAAARAGAILVPLNYRLSPNELAEIVADADPALLVGQSRYLAPLVEMSSVSALSDHIIALGGCIRGAPDFDEEMRATVPDAPRVERSPTDPVLIQYTSGTTGKPKGVISSHAGWLRASMIEPALKGIGPNSTYLNVLPMCHTGGAKWVVEVLFAGARMIVLDRFDPQLVAASIERERVTNITLVPTMLYQLLDDPTLDRYDLSSLRFINHGGAVMSGERLRQAISRFGCSFTQGYGMTEIAGGSVTFAGPADHHVDGEISPKLDTVGRPLVDCDIRLLGSDGRPVPTGEVGEVAVRSDRTFLGYWRDTQSPLDTEGYYHTGDLGRFDEDGFLTIVDRMKDMIISGGLNIFSREIEDALARHTSIAEAYIVGVPDAHWGEAVKAVIVLHPGHSLSDDDVRDWCRAHLASYKKPSIIDFATAGEVPRTSLGKVVKRAFRDPDWRLAAHITT